MKFVKHIVLLLSLIVVANAGKVTWGADGKPHIEMSGGDLKGCMNGGINDMVQDKNSSKKCN
ncbi:hypothetical protein MNB_SV-13-948 [hydrothermal vent metagenome]|uniref:Uncharacterized protein n=1 Tax=hydrothermal vent metagenome TaxID=652676 RepID=A0A1W1D0I2_9ZZZZ